MRVHTHTPHDECFLILLASPLFGSSPRIHSPLTQPTPRTHDTRTDQLHPTSYHVRPPARSVRPPACLRCCCVGAAPPWLGRQDRLGGCVGSRHGGTGSLGFGGRGRPRAQDRAARGHNHPSTPFDAGVCGRAWRGGWLVCRVGSGARAPACLVDGVPCRRGSGIRGPRDGLDGRQGRGLD